MTDRVQVLLVGDDRRLTEPIRALLQEEEGIRLWAVQSVEEGRILLRRLTPDLILLVCDSLTPELLEFARACKSGLTSGEIYILAAIGEDDAELRAAGLVMGIDDYLLHPVDRAHLQAKFRAAMRIKRMESEQANAHREIARLQERVRHGRHRMLGLLADVMEMGFPGSVARGARLARLAQGMAERFEVPARYLPDLEIVARLHEIGRLAHGESARQQHGPDPLAEGWQYVQATQAILNQVEGCEQAALLAGSIYENWDGTGHPDHLLCGQIPLRCRILRALIDLFRLMEGPRPLEIPEALDAISEHSGTRYDPLVVAHLIALTEDAGDEQVRESKIRMPVEDLKAGMRLAEDLYTESGIKLLARETTLTASALATIVSRHRFDPIFRGAVIHR